LLALEEASEEAAEEAIKDAWGDVCEDVREVPCEASWETGEEFGEEQGGGEDVREADPTQCEDLEHASRFLPPGDSLTKNPRGVPGGVPTFSFS